MRPAPPHVFGAERSYEVLSLRYVSGHSVEKIAEYLSLSERQIFRDLRRGEESLVQLLKAESVSTRFTIRADSTAALQEEIGALARKRIQLICRNICRTLC